jgi:hypothetical protein
MRDRRGWLILPCLVAAHLFLALAPRGSGALPQAPSSRAVSGVVFEDANGNGRRDAGERGLPDVAVSDQVTVAKTSAEGMFRLDAAAAAEVIFVSVPDGWAPLGRFWRGLTAATEQAADFPLRPRPAGAEFTFVHASDTHLSAPSLPRIRRLREEVARLRPAFVLITGDLVRDALRVPEAEARGYYEMLVTELAQFPVPVWTVPGNHEIFGIERHHSLISPQHPLYGKKMYRHYLGPNYYSFTWGGVRFLGLDTADIDDLWYYGHIDDAQLAWVRGDVATAPAGSAVVTFNHIPLATAVEGVMGLMDDGPAPSVIRVGGKAAFRHVTSNTGALLERLKPGRLEIALGGHMHVSEKLVYQTEAGPLRFHQAAAIVAPSQPGGIRMASGFTLYRVRNGKVDDGSFVPLDPPRAP